MQHKVKLTVIDKKVYPELQEQYCADPEAGPCPCYNVGDEFVFERYDGRDSFWCMGLNTLVKSDYPVDGIAGGPNVPHCSELWDAVSRYIYAGLQGAPIMKGWMDDERVMIACCSASKLPWSSSNVRGVDPIVARISFCFSLISAISDTYWFMRAASALLQLFEIPRTVSSSAATDVATSSSVAFSFANTSFASTRALRIAEKLSAS